MVVQCVADLADGVTQGLGASPAGTPAFFEQGFPGDELAGRLGETQQHLDRLGRQMRGPGPSCDLAFQWLDVEVPQIKAL